MWDYDSLIGKTMLYFNRADAHPNASERDVTALWLLLGLEFLLRAPLAKVHPTLLAEPDWVTVAAGLPGKPGPKSIQAKTVVTRLGHVIPGFDEQRQKETLVLIALRNEELHTGESALDIDVATWLPNFTRVVEVICAHLHMDPADLVGKDIFAWGRALVGDENERLNNEIRKRIVAAKAFFDNLKPEEVEARRALIRPAPPNKFVAPATLMTAAPAMTATPALQFVDCPACNHEVPMNLRVVRETNERLVDEEIHRDVVYIADHLACPVCNLELANTAEIRSAKIKQQYIVSERESLEERYGDFFNEPDYGND
jgi:uncharacterized protein YbaR (Trm112 family)